MKERETEPDSFTRLHNISLLNSCQLVHWTSPDWEVMACPVCPCSVSSLCFSVSAPRLAAYLADPSLPSPQLSSCWSILETLGTQNSSQGPPPPRWCWRRTSQSVISGLLVFPPKTDPPLTHLWTKTCFLFPGNLCLERGTRTQITKS